MLGGRSISSEQPGGDADTFFGVELPALQAWKLQPEAVARISRPVLSVLGSKTERLFIEGADLLRASNGHVEEKTIEGIGHLLHIERPEPVARCIADFLARHAA